MRRGGSFSHRDVLDPTIVINYSTIDALRRGVAKFQAERERRHHEDPSPREKVSHANPGGQPLARRRLRNNR